MKRQTCDYCGETKDEAKFPKPSEIVFPGPNTPIICWSCRYKLTHDLPITSKGSEMILPTDAQKRKAIPVYTGFVKYFPRAIAAVAKVSLEGGIQHGQSPETLHWDRSKSTDELDALMRHIIDGDWAQVAWRAMAHLEKQEEAKAQADDAYLTKTFGPLEEQ